MTGSTTRQAQLLARAAALGEGVAGHRPQRWWWRPLVIYLGSRLVVMAAAGVAAVINATAARSNGTGPWPVVPGSRYGALTVLERWDSAWYISIAQHGYPPGQSAGNQLARIAFFPLYPMIVRGLSSLGPPVQYTAIAVSLALGAVAALLVWQLSCHLGHPDAADRGTALFCFFPGSLVASMAYSETLMLVGAAGCLLALTRRRWLLAGVAAAVATATRPTAVATCFACAWAAALAIRHHREWRALVAPLLSPVGALAYFSFLAVHTGRFTEWFRAERVAWHERLDLTGLPGRVATTIAHPIGAAGTTRDVNQLISVLGLAFLVIGLGFLIVQRPAGHVVVYVVVTVILILTSKTIGARPRLLLDAFPLITAIGHSIRGWGFAVVLGCSAGLLAVLGVLSFATYAATP